MQNRMSAIITGGVARKMWKTIIFVLVVAYAIDSVFLKFRLFENVYNRYPGPCTVFEMNGTEDIVILPNGQAIISGGLTLSGHKVQNNNGALYVLEMSDPHKMPPKRLTFEGNYLIDHPDFNPHGISYFVTKNNDILIYVICHWSDNRDSIDVFQYYPDKGSVRLVRSIAHSLATNLNNLIVLDEDELYVTNWRYFNNHFFHVLEQLLRLPLSNVYYVKGGEFSTVETGFKSANGIHVSRNGKFIYVVNCLIGEIIAYTRSTDGSITFVDSINLGGYPIDNIFVNQETGNLWVPMFIKPFQTMTHFGNTSLPVSANVLQVTVDENADKPFESSQIESVYMSDGTNGVGAISIAAYSNNTLLLGSVCTNMIVCDVNYLQYH